MALLSSLHSTTFWTATGDNIALPPITIGLVGFYPAVSFTGTRWKDASGNGNDAVTIKGTPGSQLQSAGSAGNTVAVQAVYGATSDGIQWPSSILPTTYTLFHVSRRTAASPSGRIFTGVTNNWLSGFWSSYNGCAYHEGWITGQSNIHGLDWFISSDQNSYYRSSGADRGTGGGSASAQLSILYGQNDNETSNWAVAEIIVYNRTLSLAEIQTVETYLGTKYGVASVTVPTGQQAYTTAGTYYWTAPAGVTLVSVVCVGGGGGGGIGQVGGASGNYDKGGAGGNLRYVNSISVVPGTSYTVVVGAGGTNYRTTGNYNGGSGGTSSFNGTSVVATGGGGGTNNAVGEPTSAGNVGSGGNGGVGGNTTDGGGGGAAGYSGDGGSGASSGSDGSSGNGGGGAGGRGGSGGGGGGGVGILGQGTSGSSSSAGGSGGSSGGAGGAGGGSSAATQQGGGYGGGGGSGYGGGPGASGAVRIIWGPNRSFPSTRTTDL